MKRVNGKLILCIVRTSRASYNLRYNTRESILSSLSLPDVVSHDR